MAEAFAWTEGTMSLWTGSASASAVIGYAQNIQATMAYGMQSDAAASGRYRMHSTGRRADTLLGALYTTSTTVQRMADSGRTDVHMKLVHTALGLSAGYVLWSGAMDSVTLMGSEGGLYTYQVAYHCHQWSAF